MRSLGRMRTARTAGRVLFLGTLAVAPASHAGRVRVTGVDFEGVRSYDTRRTARFFETRTTRFWYRRGFDPGVFEHDLQNLQIFYRNEGFLTACVWAGPMEWSHDSTSVRPRVRVLEGPRWHVASLEVTGGDVLAAQSDWSPRLTAGAPYRPQWLERDRRSGLEQLARLGFLDAGFTQHVRRVGLGVDIRYEIDTGEASRIGRILLDGLERTRPHVVLREIRFDSGTRFASGPVAETQAALLATGLFESVHIGPWPDQEGVPRKDVQVRVVEKPAGDASLGLGYETDERARIRFGLRHQNLGGSGRRAGLDLRWSPRQRLAEVSGTEPWLLGKRLSFDGAATYRWLHEPSFTVESIEGRLGLRRELRRRWGAVLGYNARRTHLLAVRGVEVPAVRRNRLGSITLGLQQDNRDDYFDTFHGGSIRFEAGVADRWTGSGYRALSAGLLLRRVTPVGSRLRLATSLQHQGIWLQRSGEDVPLEERLFMGGVSSVRGFARHSISPLDAPGTHAGGRHRNEISAEMRLLVARRFDAVFFVDAGQLVLRGHNFRLDGYSAGAGAGVRVRTSFALARADIGIPLTRDSRAQFYVGVGQSF